MFARWIITESDFIREFQVVQDKISDLSITIDVLENYDAQLLKERIMRELEALHLHSDIDISIGILELPKHHSKFKRFISHIS